MQIKVCGLKNSEMVQHTDQLEPDLLGLIFYTGSPRFYQDETAPDTDAAKVGVFVDEDVESILLKAEKYGLQYVQLHGDEKGETVKLLHDEGVKVIKAFRIGEDIDMSTMKNYAPYCEYFLLDTRGERHGGTGRKFDWELLKEYKLEVPFFLSGGIRPEDATVVQDIQHPQLVGVDINSGFEVEPGIKNLEAVKQFIHECCS